MDWAFDDDDDPNREGGEVAATITLAEQALAEYTTGQARAFIHALPDSQSLPRDK